MPVTAQFSLTIVDSTGDIRLELIKLSQRDVLSHLFHGELDRLEEGYSIHIKPYVESSKETVVPNEIVVLKCLVCEYEQKVLSSEVETAKEFHNRFQRKEFKPLHQFHVSS